MPKRNRARELSTEDIRIALRSKPGSITELARSLSVSHVMVSRVIAGKDTSRRVLEAARQRAIQILEAREHAAA